LEAIMTTASTARAQGQGTAATAADEGRHLGGVAAEEAQSVAGDVRQQARSLLDDTRQQVSEQSAVQRDRLVELLRTLSHDLREMVNHAEGSSLAGQLVEQGADRTERLSTSLEGREPADLVDDVRAFARRRPGVFLAGALLAGVAAGRFARGAKESENAPDGGRNELAHTGSNPVPQPVTGPIDGLDASVAPTTTPQATSSYPTTSTGDPALREPYTDTP
jgi:uncharacterized membrane-anchored protein YhcB (DUF1043 family)